MYRAESCLEEMERLKMQTNVLTSNLSDLSWPNDLWTYGSPGWGGDLHGRAASASAKANDAARWDLNETFPYFVVKKWRWRRRIWKIWWLQKTFQISKFKQHPSMSNLLWVDSRRSEYYLSQITLPLFVFCRQKQSKTTHALVSRCIVGSHFDLLSRDWVLV